MFLNGVCRHELASLYIRSICTFLNGVCRHERWMIGNVISKTGKNETEFPDKEKKFKKIDGAVALLMGISRAMVLAGEPTGDEFYDDPIMVGV